MSVEKELEKDIRAITPITDKWEVLSLIHHTYYFTFKRDYYCISVAVYKGGAKHYIMSDKYGYLYYGGSDKEKLLKKLKEIIKDEK